MNQTSLASHWNWSQSLIKQDVNNPIAMGMNMYSNMIASSPLVTSSSASSYGNCIDPSHIIKSASSPFLLSSNPLDTSDMNKKQGIQEFDDLLDKKKKGRRSRKEPTSTSSPSLLPSKRRSEPINIGSGDDGNSGSSGENGKGNNLGKRTRESYACLRHRAMHKRCPSDCPDRRIPRPLPVAQERKQVNLKEIRLKYKQEQLSKQKARAHSPSSSSPSTSPRAACDEPADPASPMITTPGSSTSNIPAMLGNLALGSTTPNGHRVMPAPNAFVSQTSNLGTMAQMFGFPELGGENLTWEGGIGGGWDYSDWSGSDLVLPANKESWDELKSGSQWEESKFADLLNGHEFGSGASLDLENVDSYISSGSGSSSDEEDELRNQLLQSQPSMTVNSIVIDSKQYSPHHSVDNLNVMADDISDIGWESNGDASPVASDPIAEQDVMTGNSMDPAPATVVQPNRVVMNPVIPAKREGDSILPIDSDTLKDLIPQVVLARDALERWSRDPYFNRLIAGFYVRVPVQENYSSGEGAAGMSSAVVSRFGIIIEGKDFCFDPYRISAGDMYGNEVSNTTTKGIVVQLIGSPNPPIVVPISSVLNSRLSEYEVEHWMKEILAGGFSSIAGINGSNPPVSGHLPKVQDIQEKAKIVEVLNNKYPPSHLWRYLQQQQQPPFHLHSVHTR